MKPVFYALFVFLPFCWSCEIAPPTAEKIVNKSIEAHGGELYENSIIEFDFRDRHYILERSQGYFKYHRIFVDSTGTYHDILSNGGFRRTLDDSLIVLDEEWIRRYSNSVNSVAYFALLPFGLNDPAVLKNLVGEEEIDGQHYYKIKVTFNKEGGGEDFEDVFVYWINKKTFIMEYFGYYYLTDGGGIRFREATNTREAGGLLFSDYINFKSKDGDNYVEGLAEKFKNDQLEQLSEIILKNLQVKRVK